jgi:aminocarboxymuconate-semialdehyde decarboxylase
MTGCRLNGAIDVHTHFVPARFPTYAGRSASLRWPTMVHDCGKHVLEIGGEKFRALEPECWDAELRIEAQDRLGLGGQVLSPMPELLSYWLDVEDAVSLGRFVNDEIEKVCETHPDRFVGLGTVPLQDPDQAIRELEQLMTRPAFRGVEIGSHVNNRPIGDPIFEPFFAAAERLEAAIFVHAIHPIGTERLVGPALLRAVIGFPCDLAFAIASLITGGILARHRRLRICFSHGGGAFASVLPRLMQAWNTAPVLRDCMTVAPRELARSVYYDDLVYDRLTLTHLLEIFGERQLLIGSDYPFVIQDRDPLGSIAALGLADKDADLLRHANASRFLGLLA